MAASITYQSGYLTVDPTDQSTEAAKDDQRTDNPSTEGQTALPGRSPIFETRQVGQGDGQ